MSKCLILITNISPDVVGESFVSNELVFHSKVFDKVIVLPLQNSAVNRKNCIYPDNVDVISPPSLSSKKMKLRDAVSGALNILSFSEPIKTDKEEIGNSLFKLFFANYFEARNKSCYEFCEKALSRYDLSKYDDVVIYSYWFFVPCRVGVELKRNLLKKGIKATLVSRAHRYDIYQDINRLKYLPLRRFLAENTEMIFPCSLDGEKYLKKQLPDYQDRIKCLYLGTFDSGLNEPSVDFHIVSCSHTVSVKRIDRLIEALSSLKDKNISVKWTHIGDGELQEKVKDLADEKLDFLDFTFLGRLDNSEVLDFYKNNPVSLFVNVSESEGIPVSIMEASSFGIPVIATDVGGTSELIKDEVNGKLLHKDFSDEDFADTLLYFYNMDKERYMQFRMNARSCWEERFNAENNYTKFSKMLADLN